ncbi:MAG: hypothetical protein VW338_16125 [Rhodospirillaceae bacterium]
MCEFPKDEARKRFNADWASAATFDLDPAVFKTHRYGFLLAMHKNAKADIYALFLYDDPGEAKRWIESALNAIRFSAGKS